MVIAVDFDGTLCRHAFPEIGEIQPVNNKIIEFIRKRKAVYGDTIILWTCRENTVERDYLDEAVKFCKDNNIPIDYVNENTEEHNKKFVNKNGKSSRKILADIYIDDKAINIYRFAMEGWCADV